MLNYLYLSAVILAPILVTLSFRKFLDENRDCAVEKLEGAYTRAILWTIAGLLLTIFAPKTTLTPSVSMANFALSLMGFMWVQFDYARALEIRKATQLQTPVELTPAKTHFAQTVRTLGFLCCLYALLYFFSIFGLLIFFYATPLFIRVMFETLPMEPSPLRDQIEATFAQAGVKLGSIRIIQSKKKNFSNAMVCGTKFGVGPFKRTLLITEHLFALLTEEEFMAVMRHEASHFKLNHIPKRLLAALLGYFVALVLVLVPTFALFSFLDWAQVHSRDLEAVVAFAGSLTALYLLNRATFAVVHRQEHEADLESVKMGSTPEAMISALQKITADHGGTNSRKKSFLQRWILSQAHPSLDERVAAVRSGTLVKEPFLPVSTYKLAGTYAVLLAVTTYFVFHTTNPKASRAVASVVEAAAPISPHPAKISH